MVDLLLRFLSSLWDNNTELSVWNETSWFLINVDNHIVSQCVWDLQHHLLADFWGHLLTFNILFSVHQESQQSPFVSQLTVFKWMNLYKVKPVQRLSREMFTQSLADRVLYLVPIPLRPWCSFSPVWTSDIWLGAAEALWSGWLCCLLWLEPTCACCGGLEEEDNHLPLVCFSSFTPRQQDNKSLAFHHDLLGVLTCDCQREPKAAFNT